MKAYCIKCTISLVKKINIQRCNFRYIIENGIYAIY